MFKATVRLRVHYDCIIRVRIKIRVQSSYAYGLGLN